MAEIPMHATILRSLRRAKGVAQEDWAAWLGVSRKTVQRWERGDAVPHAPRRGDPSRRVPGPRAVRDRRCPRRPDTDCEALLIAVELANDVGIAAALDLSALVRTSEGSVGAAVSLIAAGDPLRAETGIVRELRTRDLVESALRDCRSELGADEPAAALQIARMDPRALIDDVLSGRI